MSKMISQLHNIILHLVPETDASVLKMTLKKVKRESRKLLSMHINEQESGILNILNQNSEIELFNSHIERKRKTFHQIRR